MVKKEFLDAKEQALKSLEQACIDMKADKEILPLLSLINEFEDCYTSSSCAGRTVLLEIPRIGDKKRAEFLGKWHRTIGVNEVKKAAKKAKNGLIWLLAQSPIFHIVVASNELADKLVKTAVASGFKHSGIKSTGKKIVVEVCSTERLDAPIGKDGFLFCNDEYLQLLIDISNEVFEASKTKISQFEGKLRQNFG